ncbi:LOW QUALITY PROTEIN: Ribonuclease H-like domain containing protein [Trema orientale]|uniref:Ribonuclease H-like domain containing protein n=1 Tax=Trema orientale TaxID=63057 RepID=A0A2P5ALD3_TREOI|nr:LOW QUALITY PROTEIN: Ribonuclease H-like domain containing protein [Trema orientale]
MRCYAHILNLIMQQGLKFINSSVVKIRDSIKYLKFSQVRKQKFLEYVNLVSVDSKKSLHQDMSTRWNSIYLMLRSALIYCRAFHLELNDLNYKYCPILEEWENVEKMTEFLKVFYDVSIEFSRSNYSTASLYFAVIYKYCVSLKYA